MFLNLFYKINKCIFFRKPLRSLGKGASKNLRLPKVKVSGHSDYARGHSPTSPPSQHTRAQVLFMSCDNAPCACNNNPYEQNAQVCLLCVCVCVRMLWPWAVANHFTRYVFTHAHAHAGVRYRRYRLHAYLLLLLLLRIIIIRTGKRRFKQW